MKQMLLICAAIAALCACSKNDSKPNPGGGGGENPPPRTVTDTLMVYSQTQRNGKSLVLTKFFTTGEIKTLFGDATYPFASNLRLVYIKNGTTLGYSRFDGVSKTIAELVQPSYPTASIDSKLICVVDKPADKYQLLLYDTLGSKTVLFETANQITSPAFTSDGQKVVFTQKSATSSNLYLIPVTGGGVAKKVTIATANNYDDYATITSSKIYFVRSRYIDSTLSSEIFSSDFGGNTITQVSNFTNNWTTASYWIKNLRKVANAIDSSSLICVSNYNNTNSEVFLYKIGGELTRMTETDQAESSPNMIANYTKD